MQTKTIWHSVPVFVVIANGGKWNKFECVKSGHCTSASGQDLHFKIGWVMDGASVPSFARSFVHQLGPHLPAVIIHDIMLNRGFRRNLARYDLISQLKELPRVNWFTLQLFRAFITMFDFYLFVCKGQTHGQKTIT